MHSRQDCPSLLLFGANQAGEEIKERLGGVMGEDAAKSITAGAHNYMEFYSYLCSPVYDAVVMPVKDSLPCQILLTSHDIRNIGT